MRSKKINSDKTYNLHLRIDKDTNEFLEKYSEILNCTKSETVRKLLKMYQYKMGRNEDVNKSTSINNQL